MRLNKRLRDYARTEFASDEFFSAPIVPCAGAFLICARDGRTVLDSYPTQGEALRAWEIASHICTLSREAA
jgi:hypothetical protein